MQFSEGHVQIPHQTGLSLRSWRMVQQKCLAHNESGLCLLYPRVTLANEAWCSFAVAPLWKLHEKHRAKRGDIQGCVTKLFCSRSEAVM